MDILSINNNIVLPGKNKALQKAATNPLAFQGTMPKLSALKADMVSFGNINPLETAENKIVKLVQDKIADLKPDQPLKITVSKENIPVAKLMAKEAYKKGSGNVLVDIREPKLEELKAKYGGEDFKWKAIKDEALEKQGLMKIDLDSGVSPYKEAGLTPREQQAIKDNYFIDLPEDIVKIMERFVEPKEILEGKLSLRPGQPLRLFAERQHEPLVEKLVEAAYKNGSKIVDVIYTEGGPNDFDRSYTEHASEKTVMSVPEWLVPEFREFIDTTTARLYLEGADPNALEGVSHERMDLISKGRQEISKAIDFYRKDCSTPWCIYYAPTTYSSTIAYPEVVKGKKPTKAEGVEALRKAATDAIKINRVGTAEAHYANLKRVSEKLNDMKLDEVHFVRRDKAGKLLTDLYIGRSDKSMFRSAEEKTIPSIKGVEPQSYIANCPTEECFTTPDNMKVRGFVTATMPLSLNGKIIKDIYVEFDDEGKINLDKVNASQNKETFVTHIKNNNGADRLGEVALVAGSPIFDTGRLFYNTLLDENAACHIAIGAGFAECLEGADKVDPEKLEDFMKDNHCNDSTTHVDFMIGGPDVLVEGIKYKEDGEPEKITLIENNEFKI